MTTDTETTPTLVTAIQKRRTLYDIGEDMAAIDALLNELGGDVTDEQVDAALTAWMAEASTALATKVDGYLMLVRERQQTAAMRKEEAARLNALATVDANSADRLKERLHQFMVEKNILKIETDHFKVTLAKNGGKAPLVLNEDQVPIGFKRMQWTIDKDAIRDALETGKELPFANIGERGSHLVIK